MLPRLFQNTCNSSLAQQINRMLRKCVENCNCLLNLWHKIFCFPFLRLSQLNKVSMFMRFAFSFFSWAKIVWKINWMPKISSFYWKWKCVRGFPFFTIRFKRHIIILVYNDHLTPFLIYLRVLLYCSVHFGVKKKLGKLMWNRLKKILRMKMPKSKCVHYRNELCIKFIYL